MTDESLDALKARLLGGMREYAADGDAGYGEGEISRCGQILDECLACATRASSRDEYLEGIKSTVNALNDLNAECDHALIETMEREDICELIIRAGALRGFNAEDEDVTEAWRDW